ncbi:MAG TPA: DNA ligase D [Candidatus Obscuribacterales bacterium]
MLQDYAKKRDFQKTPEPPAAVKKSRKQAKTLQYVIQKHAATRLHFDFRLELEGVLVSWAVPKGPSFNPADKRLAVKVEDHPYDYKDFEGYIPTGEYGAGEVIVWDQGTYEPEEPVRHKSAAAAVKEGLKKGKLTIAMNGEKLHGKFTLVRTKGGADNQWLLIKKEDEFADPSMDIAEDDTSIKSGMTLKELKERRETGKKRRLPRSVKERSKDRDKGMREEPFPTNLSPMLCYLVKDPFTREGWLFEPKLDGIRALAYIADGSVALESRRGLDLTGRYPALAEALLKQQDNLILDGEICALDEKGRPSFQLLQRRSGLTAQSDVSRAEKKIPIVYYAFDILYADGKRLEKLPLKERKEILHSKLIECQSVRNVITLGTNGGDAFEAALHAGLEGIVGKRIDSQYEVGRRSASWLKVKVTQSAEFLICGYTPGTGTRAKTFGSLLLGYYDEGELKYAGGVGTGFTDAMLKDLMQKMKPLVQKTSPFNKKVPGKARAVWLTPKLVAEVKYAEWTHDKILRVPVFMRLREDIAPEQAGPEQVLKVEEATSRKIVSPAVPTQSGAKSSDEAKATKRSLDDAKVVKSKRRQERDEEIEKIVEQLEEAGQTLTLEVEGNKIPFSNLDRVLWPKEGKQAAITKRQYVKYLARVSPYLLPHLKDRPLTLVRTPLGIHGQKFFQKHWERARPEFVSVTRFFSEHSKSDKDFLLCNNLSTLLWLGQIADVELHVAHTPVVKDGDCKKCSTVMTGSRDNVLRSVLNYPDYVVIDLDPYLYSGKEEKGAEPALHKKGFRKTCDVALCVKEYLDHLGIEAYLKTTGRTGLHIYIPIVRNFDYDSVREFARTIGQVLLKGRGKDVTMEWAVVKRSGKVFFDHNMNARGKTLASVYSARIAANGAVSAPIGWDELGSVYPTDFTINTILNRTYDVGDLWQDISDHKNNLREIIAGL